MKLDWKSLEQDLVSINMKIAVGYLIVFIAFAIYMSIYTNITETPLENILFGLALLSIVCIPFFSYFNISDTDIFSGVDLVLNISFIILSLLNILFIISLLI